MKTINAPFIDARIKELEYKVNDGSFIESLDGRGKDPKDLLDEAKSILGIGENDSIIASTNDKMKKIYAMFTGFRSVVNLRNDLKTLRQTENDIILNNIEQQLARNIVAKLGEEVETSDLYLEE